MLLLGCCGCYVAALSASAPPAGSVVPAPTPPASSVGTPQSLLYQRLAFPYAQAWRHVASSTRGHNLPPGVVMNGSLPVRDAVMRRRINVMLSPRHDIKAWG